MKCVDSLMMMALGTADVEPSAVLGSFSQATLIMIFDSFLVSIDCFSFKQCYKSLLQFVIVN